MPESTDVLELFEGIASDRWEETDPAYLRAVEAIDRMTGDELLAVLAGALARDVHNPFLREAVKLILK